MDTNTNSLDDNNNQELDIFAWCNNLIQFKEEIKFELYLINKNYVVYKTAINQDLTNQFQSLFIDSILEYILDGVDKGLIVRDFEDGESEDRVLQRTKLVNIDKLKEVLNWLKTQSHAIEVFIEEEHDLRRIKGLMLKLEHNNFKEPVYIFKYLPASNVIRKSGSWSIRSSRFKAFEADAAIRIPPEPQLLLIGQDLYVFNQSKLKQLFGYDAKEVSVARQKVIEIENNFKLSFDNDLDIQQLIKDKPSLIKKIQKINPYIVKQQELMDHADEMDIDLMQDESGSIIIMDDKDLAKFINLLNDDYIESPMSGQRYEIVTKKLLKIQSDISKEL